MNTKTMTERFLDEFLKDFDYEEIFEHLDLDIYDVFETAYEAGMIDEDLLERLTIA